MAGIILNGSVIKGLMLNGSSVSAMLNGVKVFPTEEPGPTPSKEMLFNDTNTYTNNATITLPEMGSNPYPYITFRFKGHPGALGDLQFFYDNDGTNTKYMGVRGHPYLSYAGIVGINWKITSCTPIESMTQKTLDGTNYYQTSLWPKATDKWVKYVFDRDAGIGYVYVESTLVCTITVSEDAARIDKIIISDDQGSSRDSIGNISVAGFENLDDAKNYSGPF